MFLFSASHSNCVLYCHGAEFNLSEKQAEAILDISLRRLTLLEVRRDYASYYFPVGYSFNRSFYVWMATASSFSFYNLLD
jgi:hypothetical protein